MSLRTRELLRFIVLYAAIYGAFGAASPFWPRFFEARGLSAEEIGLLFGFAAIIVIYTVFMFGGGVAAGFIPPVTAGATTRTSRSHAVLAGIRELLGQSRFRFLLLAAALIYGSHAMHDTFAIIRWNAAG